MGPLIIVIGKPGSGKSTFIQLLSAKFQTNGDLRFQALNDRDILLEMAKDPELRHLIRPLDSLNFEIVNNQAYEIAIHRLTSILGEFGTDHVLLVEFSRRDYLTAFQPLKELIASKPFVVIYLDTPFEICKARNIQRAILNKSHLVPSDEMDSYFRVDDIAQFGMTYPKNLIMVDNQLGLTELGSELERLWPLLDPSTAERRSNGRLRVT